MPTDYPPKQTIAIVVEQEVTRRLLSHVLEEEGYKVVQIEASSGGDCIIPGRPDVILLDADLRSANSIAVCRDLAARPSLQGSRIIMFGHESSSLVRLAGLRAGAEDFISGPFDYGELLAKIHRNVS